MESHQVVLRLRIESVSVCMYGVSYNDAFVRIIKQNLHVQGHVVFQKKGIRRNCDDGFCHCFRHRFRHVKFTSSHCVLHAASHGKTSRGPGAKETGGSSNEASWQICFKLNERLRSTPEAAVGSNNPLLFIDDGIIGGWDKAWLLTALSMKLCRSSSYFRFPVPVPPPFDVLALCRFFLLSLFREDVEDPPPSPLGTIGTLPPFFAADADENELPSKYGGSAADPNAGLELDNCDADEDVEGGAAVVVCRRVCAGGRRMPLPLHDPEFNEEDEDNNPCDEEVDEEGEEVRGGMEGGGEQDSSTTSGGSLS
mmetsp:Transcript_33310/g.54046  ORF Transcript_33310/g.54046 Transcript_33310/m.54046 type:complete len:310 (+) Transcript_33310:390-1319(+)